MATLNQKKQHWGQTTASLLKSYRLQALVRPVTATYLQPDAA